MGIEKDATTTIHVVLGFRRNGKGKKEADQPFQAQSAESTKRKAQRYAEAPDGGGVAFSRTGDARMGDWEDAVILGVFGDVPEDVVEGVKAGAAG
ncbi:hypothetical protein [Methylopila sp. Yamaguchi]|uniref:hypothetical protein n=1 Tax=Methylopila sp. Yamaguchi TaxID=1437817 RepID=UPI000CBC0A9C|nr:hypothetical protein [Methylopila sp. Yamaguchi]GBD48120.1 hypothetical protein METY_1333 [Methylopila sp. Yamaguchi]